MYIMNLHFFLDDNFSLLVEVSFEEQARKSCEVKEGEHSELDKKL